MQNAVSGRCFVGFGFGPIQAGLMLAEAVESGGFNRYAIAEVDQELVDAVRGNEHSVTINVAGRTGVSTRTLSGVRLYNPRLTEDRARLIEAIRESEEMATAVPSVALYSAGGNASIVAMLAEAASSGTARVIYTAENDNFAAEKLEADLRDRAPGEDFRDLQILNTVIGKMSGVISSPREMRDLGLSPLAPGFERCVLVEEFNRILVSRVRLPGFTRGIRVFQEKDDLLPFEEAKLYGHNAVHALLGSLARLRGCTVMSEIREDPELLDLGRHAFLEECGAALIARHGGKDQLFSENGWSEYAEDLLERMTNPWLHDKVDRIIRDPVRKLGWNDRFFGTMRTALEQGIRPKAMALGAAAALSYAQEVEKSTASARDFLLGLWGKEAAADDGSREACIGLVLESLNRLPAWAA